MKLFFRDAGEGHPLVLLHGIFGSSDNWITPAKFLSAKYRTISVDLRNHGQSFHQKDFDYEVMVDDVAFFLKENKFVGATLIGHSMGGKVAMNFALKYPDFITSLIVVDIAPRQYKMEPYPPLDGLNAVQVDALTSRAEAEEQMARHVEEADVRQFLLKNLQRKAGGGFSWKLNLSSITENIDRIGEDLQYEGTFEKPVLFIRGGRSNYVRDKDEAKIRKIFPSAEFQTLDTGHWVPAERPNEFASLVADWLERSGL